ncbi:hypothetical protein DRP04_12470 [Archaeoglobales archaeon]|nr:MAG: hypothetical protein DRP04_12470 [Archaeoglobales archaeon]
MSNQKIEQKQKEAYEEERRRREREKEKQEEKKKKAKPESKPIAKEETTVPEKVKIPIVELDKPAVELKEIEIDSEIPEITKEEVKIIIPVVELEKPSIELKRIELDCSLPDIIPEERKLEVPLIRIEKPKNVTCIITTFDERPPQVKVTKRMLKIPIYRPSKPVIGEIISSFDSRLDAQILRNLIVEKGGKEEVIEEEQTAEVIPAASEPSGGGRELEKFLDEPTLVGTESYKPAEKRTVAKDDVRETKTVETKSEQELTEKGGESEPEVAEDVLDEILPTRKGEWRCPSLQRPLCLIVTGEHTDGLRMVEYLISTKYTYQGQYKFSKGLPWQEEVLAEIAERQRKKTGVKHIPARKIGKKDDPHSVITSEDLIVLISANEDNKAEIVRGLKEISKRGPKCVILYASNVKPFEDLDRKVLEVDVAMVSLPERSDKIRNSLGKLLGVDLSAILEPEWKSIDELWAIAVRLYEEELKRLDKELPAEDVDYFPERESKLHYLMKRIVYSYLKRVGYKDVMVEQQIPLDENGFIGYVIPDIIADGEYWEVETGYPSSDEKELIMEYWSPYARLVWKLSKYKDNPSKIRVVFPAIYAYLFYDEIRKIKVYFEKRGIDIKFYTIHLCGNGELRRFA